MSDYSIGYTVRDEDNPPSELTEAKAQGSDIQVTSLIGWIDITPENFICFRSGCTYRFRNSFDES